MTVKNHKHSNTSGKRIVVKVGTRLLTHEDGKLNYDYILGLVCELAELKNQGHEVILVSSGAIAAGMGRLGMKKRPVAIPDKQAAAAVGQGLLIQLYEKIFSQYGLIVAQILLTRSDMISRRRYINACNTILTLLKWGVVPIINENDTVSVQEIKFGDNDRLSALVAALTDADLLIILTNIDGLYSANPWIDPGARLIREVKEITPEIKAMAGRSLDDLATGGMLTKLQAAEIASHSGVGMYIANGNTPGILRQILNGEAVCTYFHPQEKIITQRKRWIAYGQVVQGSVFIDEGARKALTCFGKSLLPVGIIGVEGNFKKGDLISIRDLCGSEVGRGLCNYSSEELEQIKKQPSSAVPELLGRSGSKEVVHRDNMVIY